MSQTMIEKILSIHSGKMLKAGDIADVQIDARVARDFGGANVVKNMQNNNLNIDDPNKTFFTFDCNPGGSDQKYATNQQICRLYAREESVTIYDIDSGIGTHIAIDLGLVGPGGTFVSTDSHANILGAIGAFGQGMGDQDIAAAWAYGKIWFKVPKSMKVVVQGIKPKNTYAKDIVLKCLQTFGAAGLLGFAAEFYGDVIDELTLSERITIASMATEMGGIISLFPPNQLVLSHFVESVQPVYADEEAEYDCIEEIDIYDLEPMISKPGHPEDVVSVNDVQGRKIDSAFIGSCTNGRFEDLEVAARILKNRKVAPGIVLKIVPSTKDIWRKCLDEGIIDIFIKAGALVGNAGCAGCAAGQIGQNGPNEVTVSTGNRNFAGKQGKGEVYLASPATVASSALAGVICTEDTIPEKPVLFTSSSKKDTQQTEMDSKSNKRKEKENILKGRVWIIPKNNIDTDMIFHNRYLTLTKIEEMGQYTFDNLEGWEDFAQKAEPGDIVITGGNFGAGSSRQQAVDCFKSLGIQAIIAKSFGAIYERNAINAGFPIMTANLLETGIENGEEISLNLKTGEIIRSKTNDKIDADPFSEIQMEIYQKDGLFNQ